MPLPALPAVATVARFIASSGVPAAIKKYGVKAVNEAKKHLKDMTTKPSPGQKKIAPVTKKQRATRDTKRKAFAAGAASTYAASKLGSNGSETKAKPKAKAKAQPRGGRTNPSDYPTYKRNTESARSFRAAQRAAKAKGNKTFTWEGRRYNTTEK
jgi:hypothetical protein